MSENKQFLELLQKKAVIKEEDLNHLIDLYQNDASDILNHLLENNMVDKKKLGRLWGDSLGVSYIDVQKATFNEEVVKSMPEEFARKNKIIPIYQIGKAITVATAKPKSSFLLNKIEQILKTQVSPLFCFESDIEEAIDYYYSSMTQESTSNNQPEQKLPVSKQQGITTEQKKYLVGNAKNLMEEIHTGGTFNPTITNDISTFITTNITPKVDLGFCISQLRINDEYTYSHCINTAILSSIMGQILKLHPNVIKELALGGLLHDVGKMRIPKSILYKPTSLSKEDIELIKKHSVLGYEIIKNIGLNEKIAEVALYHHETQDGKGYPRGLKREQIPINVQIVSIVNLYDSLISEKPNKKAISHSEALNLMLIEGISLFNFELLHKFVSFAYKNDISNLKKVFDMSLLGGLTKI